MKKSRKLLPDEVKEAIIWSVYRRGDRFVIALPTPIPQPVAFALLGIGCVPLKKKVISEGTTLLIRVPPALISAFKALPSGARGSYHPSNYLGF